MTSPAVSQAQHPAAPGRLLHDGFLREALVAPERPALEIDGVAIGYGELRGRAAAIAATMQARASHQGSMLAAVFGHRSVTSFAGTLGALLAGYGYVPLNPKFPASRTRWMLEAAECRILVVDGASEGQLESVLEGIATSLLVIAPDLIDTRVLAARWPMHIIVGAADLALPGAWVPPAASPDSIAYLLFTSGSTGTPKGVMVSHDNATHFVASAVARYGITADDRFSQMFDATFDLSVFDTFVAWERGACVCCPSEGTLINPDRFIRDHRLTVWLAVPSVAVFMKRFGVLTAGRYPTLRWSLFCGEALPVDVAAAWSAAAPQSIVENLYGPTEVTVACCVYRWDGPPPPAPAAHGIVPIGQPLPGMKALIVDENLREVDAGSVGELLMTGPQVSLGYWRNDAATARSYVRQPGSGEVFYRTGDRVRRPIGNEPIGFVGRSDDQVKVLGHRVELAEVESRLRSVPGISAAAAVAWPVGPTGAGGVIAFVSGSDVDVNRIQAQLREQLPAYAVPRSVRVVPTLPRNDNGKVDRPALQKMLRDE